ncbi:MAG: alpha/beta fold hydrolase [Bdellovibrionia bacterium]
MKSPCIHALHGFLGCPSDWDVFSFPSWVGYDFFSNDPKPTGELDPRALPTLWDAGKKLNQLASQTPGPRVLMGYSLGGRVALHALTESPELWSCAVIISAHPGIPGAQLHDPLPEQVQRARQDDSWAQRFEGRSAESWESLIQAWNSQAVFQTQHAGVFSLKREASWFSCSKLASALRHWSLAAQTDLRSTLKSLTVPTLWISGQHDVKYKAIGQSLSGLHPRFKVEVIADGGHRVPWENPVGFQQAVSAFLDLTL